MSKSGKNYNKISVKNSDENLLKSVLVYSDDPKDKEKLSGAQTRLAKESEQKLLVEQKQFVVVFRLEKNGRGGKTVTLLDKLPAYDPFLKELTKELKNKCGVGGTYQMTEDFGVIEIQGDKRDAIKKILEAKNIKFKGM